MSVHELQPNKAPEPTAIIAVSSACAGYGFRLAVAQLHTLDVWAARIRNPSAISLTRAL